MADKYLDVTVKDRKTGETLPGSTSRMGSANNMTTKSEVDADMRSEGSVSQELKGLTKKKNKDHLDRGDQVGMQLSLQKRRGKDRK